MMNNGDLKNVQIRKPFIMMKDFSKITEPDGMKPAEYLEALGIKGGVLIIADAASAADTDLQNALKSLDNVRIILPSEMKSSDFISADNIIVTESVISEITKGLSK